MLCDEEACGLIEFLYAFVLQHSGRTELSVKKTLCFTVAAAVSACLSVIASADAGDAAAEITRETWVFGGICTVFVTGVVVMAVLVLKDGVFVRRHHSRDTDSSRCRKNEKNQ